MTEPVAADPNPELSEQLARRIRRMMLIAGLTTGLGIAAVFVAIGYRLFKGEGSVAAVNLTERLPKGARILSTSVAGDRLVITVDAGGVTEIRTFDARTLKPAGRLTFASEP